MITAILRKAGRGRVALPVLFLLACPQSRADQVYTSSASFEAASTGLTTIAFTGLAGPTHSAGLLGLPLVVGDVTFVIDGPGAVADPLAPYALAPAYTNGDYLFPNYGSPDEIDITLPSSTAVGFNVGGAFGDPGSITVTLSDGTIEALTSLSAGDYVTAGSLNYLGFTSTVGITSVDIVFEPPAPGGTTFGALDNFSYGAAAVGVTPEPSSIVLLGTGMIAAARMLKRRRFQA